ncbi:unnamed protein product [Clonostachys chloroleuca]|uniref:AB hydrolase-1 domain-containing protein n=1 Tax=Clonostachys chloroleuca TaxID=1926264 RepID=A0AA35Q7K8_9HYPO|nr:unnamed protein product [Clonostachys chloroleuca]
MRLLLSISALLSAGLHEVVAQTGPAASVQNNTFNATHGPYNPQTAMDRIKQANLSAEIGEKVLVALNFERSNWAGTSVRLDPFYTDLPSNWSSLPPGSIVKIEERSNISLYTIPPTLGLSRFIYTTKTFNGTAVPASAFVLWPWFTQDIKGSDGLPIITLAHGAIGWSGEGGMSHMRNLGNQWMTTSAASARGFVVIVPDYVGLGLDHDGHGNIIPHQFLANEASGYDLLYATKAAKKAWRQLGSKFVIMGHSQGGGAAWGASLVLGRNDQEAKDLGKGYLGTIAGAPWLSLKTRITHETSQIALNSVLSRIATGVNSIFPEFSLSDWLTEKGERVVRLLQDLQGTQSVATQLFISADLIRSDWDQSWYYQSWERLTSVIAKPFAGPLLVLQGTGDSTVNATGVRAAVDATCAAIEKANIEYIEFEKVNHLPIFFFGENIWLDWVLDRFAGKPVKPGCRTDGYVKPLRNSSEYKFQTNWFIEYSMNSYSG